MWSFKLVVALMVVGGGAQEVEQEQTPAVRGGKPEVPAPAHVANLSSVEKKNAHDKACCWTQDNQCFPCKSCVGISCYCYPCLGSDNKCYNFDCGSYCSHTGCAPNIPGAGDIIGGIGNIIGGIR